MTDETEDKFDEIAAKVHKLTVNTLTELCGGDDHHAEAFPAVITGMLSGVLEVMWRTRQDGKTVTDTLVLWNSIAEAFISQMVEQDGVAH